VAEKAFGIDLGTTYSAIAYINDYGKPEVINNREGEQTTPSVVYIESESNFVVGKEAKNETILHPDTTISLIKRHMGTKATFTCFGKTFTPEIVSSMILKDLVDYARDATGIATNKVVITVPAYFGLAEKEATRQAGEIAGLEVIGIVEEPVAAALSVGIRPGEPQTVFVYDLGGGTFDCTMMEISESRVEVIVVDGKRQLGGADWDAKLSDLVKDRFVSQAKLGDDDPMLDEDFAQKLFTQVEDLKKSLSRKDSASITLAYKTALEKVEITRAEFEVATRTLVAETIDIVRRALTTGQAKRPDLKPSEILLVGGSSKMPMIEAALIKEFGWTVRKTDLDLAVAKGAAVYGFDPLPLPTPDAVATGGADAATATDTKRLLPSGKAISISTVLSRSLGVKYTREAAKGYEDYIGFEAHANDRLPARIRFTAGTLMDNQQQVDIHVFEQASERESEEVEDNREVTPPEGALLSGLSRLPKGSPIEFDLEIDGEGNAAMSALEPLSGKRVHLKIVLAVMQQEDVDKAKAVVAGFSRRAN
jgi:molecular chaperone DnaK